MCQPGGGEKRCPVHQPASLALRSVAEITFDLEGGQVMHTFRRLRSEGADAPAPTLEEYKAFVAAQRQAIQLNSSMTDAQKKIANRRVSKKLTEEGLPDGPTFYALKNLDTASREQANQFAELIEQAAESSNQSKDRVRQQFSYIYQHPAPFDIGKDRQADALDARTRAVAQSLQEINLDTSTPQPRTPSVSYEYDKGAVKGVRHYEDDGRLEVDLWNGKVAVFRNVGTVTISAMRDGNTNDRLLLLRALSNGDEHKYESTEAAERASQAFYCRECQQYRALQHVCAPKSVVEDSNFDLMEAIERRGTSLETDFDRQLIAARFKGQTEDAIDKMIGELKKKVAGEGDAAEEPYRYTGRNHPINAEVLSKPREEREVTHFVRTIGGLIDLDNSPETGLFGSRILLPRNLTPSKAHQIIMEEGGVLETSCFSNFNIGSYHVYADVAMWAEGENGDIKYEVSELRCTCPEYARNYTCQHVTGEDQPLLSVDAGEETIKLHTDRVEACVEALHKSVNLSSYLNNEASSYKINARGDATQVTRTTLEYEGVRFRGPFPSASAWEKINDSFSLKNEVWITPAYGGKIGISGREGLAMGESDVLEGQIGLMKDEDGNYSVNWSRMRCEECGERVEECRCNVNFNQNYKEKAERILLSSLTGRIGELSQTTLAQRLEEAEKLIESNYNIADAMEVENEEVPGLKDGMVANVEAYQNEFAEGKRRKKEGQDVADWEVTEVGEVTGGLCAPGTGRYMGFELEFWTGSVHDSVARSRIARALYEAGLSDIDYPTHYHGYNGDKWHIEADCTVSGEVVSPKMSDSPEHWEELRQVLQIIKDNGGESSKNTGGHIHFGLDESKGVGRTKGRIHQVHARYRDEVRRMQTDPKTGKHRGAGWCRPVSDEMVGIAARRVAKLPLSYMSDTEYDPAETVHHHDLNTEWRKGARIEMRGRDGSLDLGHIKTNAAMIAGMVRIAESDEFISTPEDLRASHQGRGVKLLRTLTGKTHRKGLPQTKDEITVADAGYRAFLDRVMPNAQTRQAGARLAGAVGWQEEESGYDFD